MPLTENNVTFDRFQELLMGSYERNNHVRSVSVTLIDGQSPVIIAFESKEGFQEDQMKRRGELILHGDIFRREVTISELYALTQAAYEGNNRVRAVTAELFDGHDRAQITFESRAGFALNQMARKGTLEYKII